MPELREEPFHLTNTEAGIVEADGTANQWSDIWKYQVPPGMAIKLTSRDTFSLYAEDTTPAEIGNSTAQVRILVRNAAETAEIVVYGPALYARSREFQERPKMARLAVGQLEVKARQFIVIQIKDDGTVDASDSYFDLFTTRIYAPLGV